MLKHRGKALRSRWNGRLLTTVKRFAVNDDGSTSIEYALIAIMTGITAIGALTAMGDEITGGLYKLIADAYPTKD